MITVPQTNADASAVSVGDDLFADAVRPHGKPEDDGKRAEREVAELAENVFNLSIVKDAVTRLHREDDEQFAKLAQYEGARLGDMVKDHEAFLRSQETGFNAAFADDRQRRMFRDITRLYFQESLVRARSLRNRMIDAFHTETVTRQNQEFADRALRPENAFNDLLQTGLRDMILYNLENLFDTLPEAGRKERLDAAAREFYQKVLEKRLELDPRRMRTMLDAPSVRRVLGRECLKEFEDKCAAAIRDEELEDAAREWVREELEPEEAAERAEKAYADAEEGKRAVEQYRHWRRNDNLRRFLSLAVDIQKAWEEIAANEYRREAIPAAVRRNRAGMYRFFCESLDRRRDNGGLAPEPDYLYFAGFAARYSSRETLEKLRGEKDVFSFIDRLGGPDGFAFQAALRLIIAKSSEEDRALFHDLALALGEAERLAGRKPAKEEANTLLQRFVAARKLKLADGKAVELDAADAIELARRCGGTMAFQEEDKRNPLSLEGDG